MRRHRIKNRIELKTKFWLILVLFSFHSVAQSSDTLQVNVDSISVDSAYKYQDVSYVQDLNPVIQSFDSLHISIQPPLYFMKLDSVIHGFVHLGANASIMVNEVEPIILGIAPYYTEKNFEDIHQKLIKKDTLYMNDGSWGFLMIVQFMEAETNFERIVLVTPSKNKAIVVMASYPLEIRQMLQPIFLESLKTLKVER